MRKMIALFSIFFGITLLLTSCSPSNDAPEASISPIESVALELSVPSKTPSGGETFAQMEVMYMSFLEAIDVSDTIFVGEFMDYELTDWGGIDYAFKVKDVWRGDFTDEVIHYVGYRGNGEVMGTGLSYELGGGTYQKGQDYVLIMERHEALFYEYPHHTIIGDMFIPVEGFSNSLMYGQPLSNHSDEVFENVTSLREWVLNAEPPQPKVKNFTWATDFPTVVKEAELILEVTITGISVEGVIADANVYFCDVSNLIKGDSYVSFEGRNDIAVSLKGGLEIGGSYLVLCNRVDATSIIYMQSSPVSVIPLSETETIEEIYALVAGD